MDKVRLNIAVIEPSDIVFEGLSTLLHKHIDHVNVLRLQNLEELEHTISKKEINLAILNPSSIQNKLVSFEALKQFHTNIAWISLIYSFYADDILSLFNDSISIVGNTKQLANKINKALNPGAEIEQGNDELTEREIEVLGQLAQGLSNKAIADKLNISVHTVISHRKNLTEKTGIKSLPGLTIYAISNKIISLDSETL